MRLYGLTDFELRVNQLDGNPTVPKLSGGAEGLGHQHHMVHDAVVVGVHNQSTDGVTN